MSKNDTKIKDLLAKVAKQQTDLGVKPRAVWNTNGIFKFKDGSFLNINTVKDPQQFVEALSYLLEKEGKLSEAAEMLEVTAKPFSWDGYTLEDWAKDFKLRIKIVKWDEKKAALEETQKKLKSLVSEEARTESELDDIEKFLS